MEEGSPQSQPPLFGTPTKHFRQGTRILIDLVSIKESSPLFHSRPRTATMSPGSRLNRAQAVPPMPPLTASAQAAAAAAAAAANPLAVSTNAQAQGAPAANLLVIFHLHFCNLMFFKKMILAFTPQKSAVMAYF